MITKPLQIAGWRQSRSTIFSIACLLSLLVIFNLQVRAQSFTVTVSPQTLTIHPGDQNVPLTITLGNSSYTGPITVALTGLPSGITTAPLSLAAGSSGTLLVSASLSADQEAFPATGAGDPNTHTSSVTVVAAAGSEQATTPLPLTVSLSNPSFAPSPGDINLPIMKIDTNGAPILSEDIDVPGTVTITSADGQTTYFPNASSSDNTATFHLHGTTTAAMPKVPYKVKLSTSTDLLPLMGLSCPYVTGSGKPTCDKSKSYLLLANYDDKTMLRDWAASALANAIPIGNGYLDSPANSPTPSGTSALMPWAPHSLFVELYVNSQYEGTYQLIEQIKVDSHRVNITEMSQTDTSADQVTGGYLLEIDQHKDEAYVFTTPQNLPIGLKDPDFSPEPEVPEQTSYITNYVDQAENALFSSNFTNPTTGWRAYFDEASAVNFYIVNDVMGNADGGGFYSSDYFYKDRNNPLLYMGPIWDFDTSAGNVYYSPVTNPTAIWMQEQAAWYKRWFMDPGFKRDVATQFNKLESNGVFSNWLNSIQQEAASLQQAQTNNFQRWPMLGVAVWPNMETVGSYAGEVAYMTNYLKLRIAYLDSVLNSKAQTTTTISVPGSSTVAGSPVTLSAKVSGGSSPGGTVTFLIAQRALGGAPEASATLDGGGNASVTLTNLPVGSYNIQAVYSGDGQNALSASNPTQISVAPSPAGSTTSIATASSSAATGAAVAFTAAVIGSSGTAIPTGTLTFTSNGANIGTATLGPAATATFSTTSLPGGNNEVQATYSGDGNYQPSTSSALTIAMAVPPVPPSFTLTAAPASATVNAGSPASFTLAVTPQNGFTQPITFSCSGLPSGDQCAFSPSTVTPSSNSAVTVALTITTGSGTVSELLSPGNGPWTLAAQATGGLGGLAIALLIWPWSRRRKWPLTAILAVIALFAVAIGCGGAKAAPPATPQTYSVTVTAAGGSVSQTANLALTVTPVQK